jgi:hypothetical protein
MECSEGGLPTSIEFSASITVPTALGAPRFAQRTAVTIPDTVAVVIIAIKAARMTGLMEVMADHSSLRERVGMREHGSRLVRA